MSRFIFTFEPSASIRIINHTEDSESYYQVVAKSYPEAVNKIIKLKLPNITSEEHIRLTSVQEESAMSIIKGSDDQEQEV